MKRVIAKLRKKKRISKKQRLAKKKKDEKAH
jgi:hypothetical protein